MSGEPHFCGAFRHRATRTLLIVGCLLSAAAHAGEPLSGAPLAARSAAASSAMFTSLPASDTGIQSRNLYEDPEMWGARYQEFALGSIGTGVTIGDYDNDGRPDVFVVCKTSQSRLFRNLGGWRFEDVTERAGLQLDFGNGSWMDTVKRWTGGSRPEGRVEHWQQGATFADIDNDGRLDLYVCRFNAPNLLFMNRGDGTFREEAAARGLAIVDASAMAAFCDYDRDGKLDVYIHTSLRDSAAHPNGGPGHLLRNTGEGKFVETTGPAGIRIDTLSHSATWWDYDEDGWPDLYVGSDFAGPDVLYRNNRDGTFMNVIEHVVPHQPYSSMGADLGDVNNDGRIDLFVADMATTTHEKDHRGMARAREMNRDNDTAPAPQYSRNALYLNEGVGRMREAACLAGIAATDWTWSVRFEDLDNDGRLDLHVTNGMTRELQNSDLMETLMRTESQAERMRIVRAKPVMRERHLAYRNAGDLRFEDVSDAWGLGHFGVGFGTAFGDLDGDGDLDVVYASYDADVTVLRNDCASGHRLVVALRGTHSNRFGVGATVRVESASGVQVRQLVLARGYLSSSEPVLHFGLGEDSVVARLTVQWPGGAVQTFEHVRADQRLTLTEPDAAVSRATLRSDTPSRGGRDAATATQFKDVTTTFKLGVALDDRVSEPPAQPLLGWRFNRRGPALAVSDMAAASQPQLLLGGTSSEPARLLTRAADGRYGASPLAGPGSPGKGADGPILVFDADGDGANDLLTTRTGTRPDAMPGESQPRLWLNDGRGAFRLATDALPAWGLRAGALVAADFDRDGKLDVFAGARVKPGEYPLAPDSALLRGHGGRFEDVTDVIAPGLRRVGMVTSALWSDVDTDGWPDLLVALDWGEVKYFHNDAGRSFTDWTERAGFATAGTGWWSSLASADFNQDGRPDFVAGNVGLNTPFAASPERPTVLFYGEFGQKGAPLLIEAYHQGDKLYPRRTRHVLGREIPAILRRYRGSDEYARATLDQILGADRLAQARKFAVTQLSSGVFLSQADGTYRFSPLPRIAQIAPLQGMVAQDFDGDGHADLCAAQNLHATPGIGHFDGGLGQWLRGDGRGSFTAIEPIQSGFVVPGDAKGLVATDLDEDGAPDILVSRNNATTLAFRNESPGSAFVRVRLRGPVGNPDAIGARLDLRHAGGTRQTVEITAGSSYFSQCAPVAWFGFGTGAAPAQLRVHWPDGRVTDHVVAQAGTLELRHP